MIVNKLGNTDLQLSALGLGAWAIGGGDYKYGWGHQEDKESIATIRHAVEMGINWIDTAPVYGAGHSEEIIGKALEGIRDNVIIATKCGLRMDDNNENLVYNLTEKSIRIEVEESLKRLNTDVIDLYQLHTPFPEEQMEEAWATLAKLIDEGKIRYAGVSNFTVKQLRKIHAIHPVSSLQPQYNMLEPDIELGLLDYCKQNSIGVIAYSPMCRGLLTGKFTLERAANLPKDDNRLTVIHFQKPFVEENIRMVEKLRPIAERNNKTLAQLSIAWVLRKESVTSAIVGARTPSQIEQTVPAGDWKLSDEDLNEVESILGSHYDELKKIRGEGINYLDSRLNKSFDASMSPEFNVDYALDIYGIAGNNGLELSLTYNKYEYERASIENFSNSFKKNLQRIINHCVEKKKKISDLGVTSKEYHLKKLDEKYIEKYEAEKWPRLEEKRDYRYILSTGGTGFLGGHLVFELLTNTDAELYLPIRGATQEKAEERLKERLIHYFGEDFYDKNRKRLIVMNADLSKEKLGLSDEQYDILIENVEVVLHPAANVKHYGAYEELYKDNVTATEQLLRLAATGRKSDFHYISTISVGEGNIPGKDYILFSEFSDEPYMELEHIYLKTKYEGEKRVLHFRETEGIHASIHRVGNLISHSETGIFQPNIQDDFFFNIMRGAIKLEMLSEKMKKMVFDMSFINFTAKSVAALMLSRGLDDQIYHVLNPNSLPMLELASYLRELGFNLNNVMASEESKYLAKLEGNAEFEKTIELLKIHSWVFEDKDGTKAEYRIARTVHILEKLGIVWPKTTKELVKKMIDYCEKVNFL